MSQKILEVKELYKKFGFYTAVDHISFSVEKGEIVGMLGPNGAGKTTTIQMLLGLMTPDAGHINYFDKPLKSHRVEILSRLNHMSGYSYMPWRMSIYENLDVFALLYQVKNRKPKIIDLATRFGVSEFLHKKFQDLSAGQRTRAFLVKAFINDPELVLLDEPTASLDPDIAVQVRTYLLKEQKERNLSIVITSHNMREVEELCDQVVFLHKGKVLAVDTPEGLARRNTQSQLQLMIADGLKRLLEILEMKKYEYLEKSRFISITLPEKDIAEFLLEIAKRGVRYSEIELNKPSLEDFFLSVSKEKKNL